MRCGSGPPRRSRRRKVGNVERPYRTAFGIIGIVVAVALGLWMLVTLRAFLVLILIAGVFAAALDRPVNFTQRILRLRRRGFAVLIVMLLGLGVLVGFGYTVYTPIASQSDTLQRDLPA